LISTAQDISTAQTIHAIIDKKYSIPVILCVMRHHPNSHSTEAILDTLMQGIDVPEWLAKDGELLRTSVEIIRRECSLCLEEYPVEEMYTLDCAASHRFCYDCVRQGVEIAVREKKPPYCMQSGCPHALTESEISEIFGKTSDVLKRFKDTLLQSALQGMGNCIGCPTPNCTNWLVLPEDTTTKVRCYCEGCDSTFCSLCKVCTINHQRTTLARVD
jgi:hypothetical protein